MVLNQSIAEFLNSAQLVINNTLGNPSILAAVSLYGYTEAKIREGQGLLEQALAAQQKRQTEYAEQLEASAEFETSWQTGKQVYMRHLKIARLIFKDDVNAIVALQLNGERKQSLSGWLLQANTFYLQALASAAIQAKFAEFNITVDVLQAAHAQIQAIEATNQKHQSERAEAQEATRHRDQTLDILNDWLTIYLPIAEMALEEQPQLAESLGILVRSKP